MVENRNPAQDSRFRLIRLIFIISLVFFASLLGWQLFVLISRTYPEHIIPAVKILSGSQESIPVAYAWTLRLALITVVGLVVSLIGWIAMSLSLRRRQS